MPMMIASTTRAAPLAAAVVAPRATSPLSRAPPPGLFIRPFWRVSHPSLRVWVGSAPFDADAATLVALLTQAFYRQRVVPQRVEILDQRAQRAVVAAR